MTLQNFRTPVPFLPFPVGGITTRMYFTVFGKQVAVTLHKYAAPPPTNPNKGPSSDGHAVNTASGPVGVGSAMTSFNGTARGALSAAESIMYSLGTAILRSDMHLHMMQLTNEEERMIVLEKTLSTHDVRQIGIGSGSNK